MARFPNPNQYGYEQSGPLGYQSRVGSTTQAAFFNGVYGWMAAGLALTAAVAWFVSRDPTMMQRIFRGPVLLILVIAELGLVFTISAAINRISATAATALFLVYSALNGLTLSAIFIVYTQASLAGAFIVTAGMFAAMSAFGYFTRIDLTRFGALLFMALIGLVIASVVNMFWANSTLYWIVTYAGVFIFVGLTAYDTQKLRIIAAQTENDPRLAARLSVNGALMLYLDFLNLFLFLLRIMGDRRR
jgi:FtsH-binding integral membrane protein